MRVLGEVFCANVANWGVQTGLVRPSVSRFGGNSWSPWTYALTGVGGWLVGRFIIGRFNREAGLNFGRGVADTIIRKLLWTEVISNVPAMDRYLGATPVQYDANGNVLMQQPDGSWDAMMGYGQLTQQSALDGYGQLVPERPLDGLENSNYLDQPAMGHALATTPSAVQKAMYQGSAYANPFQSAYSSVM